MLWGSEVDGTDPGLCPVLGFSKGSAEPSGSTTRDLQCVASPRFCLEREEVTVRNSSLRIVPSAPSSVGLCSSADRYQFDCDAISLLQQRQPCRIGISLPLLIIWGGCSVETINPICSSRAHRDWLILGLFNDTFQLHRFVGLSSNGTVIMNDQLERK